MGDKENLSVTAYDNPYCVIVIVCTLFYPCGINNQLIDSSGRSFYNSSF